jgi:hypothetical protein
MPPFQGRERKQRVIRKRKKRREEMKEGGWNGVLFKRNEVYPK